eukprot:COSAG02_NODE_2603_length_8445_cov_5.416247_6_plen_423_part_00
MPRAEQKERLLGTVTAGSRPASPDRGTGQDETTAVSSPQRDARRAHFTARAEFAAAAGGAGASAGAEVAAGVASAAAAAATEGEAEAEAECDSRAHSIGSAARTSAQAAAWVASRLELPDSHVVALEQELEKHGLDGQDLSDIPTMPPKLGRALVRSLLQVRDGDDEAEQQCELLLVALQDDDDSEVRLESLSMADTTKRGSESAFGKVKWSALVCGMVPLAGALYFAWFGVIMGLRSQCELQANLVGYEVRKRTEDIIGAAPIWARNTILGIIISRTIRESCGLTGGPTLTQQLLLGARGSMSGGNHAAGWRAIVGDDDHEERQSTWREARRALAFTTQQACGMSLLKLVLWHCSQPLSYMWIFGVFFCRMTPDQQALGAIVALRELVYLAMTVLAASFCPVFLLLDIGTVWTESSTRLQR